MTAFLIRIIVYVVLGFLLTISVVINVFTIRENRRLVADNTEIRIDLKKYEEARVENERIIQKQNQYLQQLNTAVNINDFIAIWRRMQNDRPTPAGNNTGLTDGGNDSTDDN